MPCPRTSSNASSVLFMVAFFSVQTRILVCRGQICWRSQPKHTVDSSIRRFASICAYLSLSCSVLGCSRIYLCLRSPRTCVTTTNPPLLLQAPGAHSPKYDYVKPSTPGVKFAGRHKPVEDGAIISPGPAAYGFILTSPLMKCAS